MTITGTITLKTGDIIEITDSNILASSLKLTMSTCQGLTYDLGSFNAGMLNVGIFDDEALDHEFDGAKIELSTVEEMEEETVTTSLGIYLVDGSKTQRKKNVVKLTAQDYSTLFDIELITDIKESTYTPYALAARLCSDVNIKLSNESFSEFPNNSVRFMPSSASVQTARDAIMWVAQLISCNAIIDRQGQLVFRPARYLESNGDIIVDYESDGSDRVSTQFSDVRTFIKYLSAYVGNTPKEYSSDISPSDTQARAASFALPKNPLVETLSEYEQISINEVTLEYLDNFATRAIKAQMFFNPSLKLGDTIRFSGGKIDVRKSIVGTVTGISWKYHGLMTVSCAAPQAVKAV